MTAAALKRRMLDADNAPVAPTRPFSQRVEIPAGRGEAAKTVELQDEYAWLRGAKWPNETVDEPEIVDYLTRENDYCKDFLKSLEQHQTGFFETLKGRIKLTDKSVEAKRRHGGTSSYFYYTRTEEKLQYSIDCRRLADTVAGAGEAAEEEVLLDRNRLAEGKKFCRVLGTTLSESGKLMAYRSDFVGDENYKLTFETVVDGDGGKFLTEASCERKALPESGLLEQVSTYCFHELPGDADAPVGVFYAVRNAQLRPTRVFYHRFTHGASVDKDVLVFESKDEMFTVGVAKSSDGEYLLVRYHSKTEDEVRYIPVSESVQLVRDADQAGGQAVDFAPLLQVLRPIAPDIEYSADHGAGAWWLKTKEGCKKEHFRVLRKRTAGSTPDADFQTFLPEHPELCLSGFLVTKSYMGATYLSTATGQPKLLVYPADSADSASADVAKKQVLFPGVDPEQTSHDACFSGACNYEEDLIAAAVDTPERPTEWYRYPHFGAAASDMELLKRKEVPNYEPALYGSKRLYVEYAEDVKAAVHPSAVEEQESKGTAPATARRPRIPVTLFYRKDKFRRDGSMPLLLNGYGSYGISEEPVWSNLNTLYADLGFLVATAHIRGGGDLGEPWYQAAKFLTKKRTFLDFIAVAEALAGPPDGDGSQEDTNGGYTRVGNVAIVGGSAGGMLVGACLNLRPALFRAVLAHVPFVTVLDTMLDASLPLTPGEFKEWGNPREAGYFDYMRGYCPYENLDANKELLQEAGHFPSVFATTGLSDYRVGYYEGAKWIARMRAQIKRAKQEAAEKFGAESQEAQKVKEREPLVVMETNMAAGHAGASGRFDRLKEVSRDVAFLATEFELIQ